MAFCAWCGNHVQQVSYAACPRCGNPTNGAQRTAGAGSDRSIGIIIGLLVGGLVVVAIVGTLAMYVGVRIGPSSLTLDTWG